MESHFERAIHLLFSLFLSLLSLLRCKQTGEAIGKVTEKRWEEVDGFDGMAHSLIFLSSRALRHGAIHFLKPHHLTSRLHPTSDWETR